MVTKMRSKVYLSISLLVTMALSVSCAQAGALLLEDWASAHVKWSFGGTFAGSTNGGMTTTTNPAFLKDGPASGDYMVNYLSAGDDAHFRRREYGMFDFLPDTKLSFWVLGNGSGDQLMIQWTSLMGNNYAYNGTSFVSGDQWGYLIDWTGWKYHEIAIPEDTLYYISIFMNDNPDSKTGTSHVYFGPIKLLGSAWTSLQGHVVLQDYTPKFPTPVTVQIELIQ